MNDNEYNSRSTFDAFYIFELANKARALNASPDILFVNNKNSNNIETEERSFI